MIRTLLFVAALAFGASAVAGPQQEKMKQCNQQAAGKKGQERMDFMKTCLGGPALPPPPPAPPAPPAPGAAAASQAPPLGAPAGKVSPQERMRKCNQEAAGKKGEERRTFMSQCLKAGSL